MFSLQSTFPDQPSKLKNLSASSELTFLSAAVIRRLRASREARLWHETSLLDQAGSTKARLHSVYHREFARHFGLRATQAQSDQLATTLKALIYNGNIMLHSHLNIETKCDSCIADVQYRHTSTPDKSYFETHPIQDTEIRCVRCAASRKLKSEIRPRHDYDLRLVLGHLATLDSADDELERRRSQDEKDYPSLTIEQLSGENFPAAVATPRSLKENAVHCQDFSCRNATADPISLLQSEEESDSSSDSDDSDSTDEEYDVVDNEDDFEHRLQPSVSYDPCGEVTTGLSSLVHEYKWQPELYKVPEDEAAILVSVMELEAE